jgi:hypothetical protein
MHQAYRGMLGSGSGGDGLVSGAEVLRVLRVITLTFDPCPAAIVEGGCTSRSRKGEQGVCSRRPGFQRRNPRHQRPLLEMAQVVMGEIFNKILQNIADMALKTLNVCAEFTRRQVASECDVVACEVRFRRNSTWATNAQHKSAIQAVKGC